MQLQMYYMEGYTSKTCFFFLNNVSKYMYILFLESSPDLVSRDPMSCPSRPQAEQTLGQWLRRAAAALRCVRHSSTSVSAPVGLGGRQPGNYTALTTSPERKAHCHTHKNTYLYVSIQITLPHLHTRYLSLLLTHTHTHSEAPAKHKDYIMSRRITMTPT